MNDQSGQEKDRIEQFDRIYVTAITNRSYYKGLKVLIKSLRKTKTMIPLAVMIPTDSDDALKEEVKKIGGGYQLLNANRFVFPMQQGIRTR